MDIYISQRSIKPSAHLVQTKAIQDAIDECEATGGGTVYFEPGIYRTGTLYLKSNTYLHLPPSCILKGSDNLDDYNEPNAWVQNTPIWAEHSNGKHLIVALEVENCGIVGGGVVDGNGKHFGYKTDADFFRPGQMVYLCESKNVRIRDVELLNSAYWTCFVHGCEDVIITGVHIKNNPDIANSDGIDIDCSRRVVISNCIIDSQDDCITFRGDNGLLGNPLKDPTKFLEDITVTNCQLRTAGCNAFRIGVGNAMIRNCRVSNVVIRDSSKGICMESRFAFNDDEKIGTPIENISFDNIFIEAKIPIFIASDCFGITEEPAPAIKNIRFSNVDIFSRCHIVVEANDNGAVVDNISFNNINITMQGVTKRTRAYGYLEWGDITSAGAFYVANATNVRLNNVNITVEEDAFDIEKAVVSQNSVVKLSDVQIRKPKGELELYEERNDTPIKKSDIFKMMQEFGIKKNDKVVVHSALKPLGPIANGADGLLDAMRHYLDEGILVIPTHTWSITPKTGVFDVKTTGTCLGVLSSTAVFRSKFEGTRSLHPTHSVVAFGEGRKEFIKDEENCLSPTPENSWMGRLYEDGGKILLLGVDMNSNTFIHWVEETLNVPNRISKQILIIDIKDRDGNIIKAKPFHGFHSDGIPEGASEHFNNFLKPLMYAGAVKKVKFGQDFAYCCDARKTFETIKALLLVADYDLCASDKEIPESYYVK